MIDNIKNSFVNFKPYINGYENMFKSSVLISLVDYKSQINILFQVRSKNLKVQPNEISFPGGKFEQEDITFEKTAIRETCEELGLNESDIDIICPLDVFVTPFNMLIHPFLGVIKNFENININKDEVDHIFLVPLSFFLNNEPIVYNTKVNITPKDDFPYDLIPNGNNYKFKEGSYNILLYKYNNYVIWGITAAILKNFIKNLKERF